jgi:hypothetical protein
MIQVELDFKTAGEHRNNGMAVSVLNADSQHEGWSSVALEAVRQFFSVHEGAFMAEDVRLWASWVPRPPSARAWGSVFVSAARNKIVRSVGWGRTKNVNAHRTPAMLWTAY